MPIEKLPRPLINQMLRQAVRSTDREICGLIGGRDGTPERCYPVPNIAAAPDRLFEMDPKGQIEAMRQMRERGETLFGIYHSHPRGPAAPSARDIAEDAYPDALYLVISLDTQGVLELQGFRIRNGQSCAVEIEVVEAVESPANLAVDHAG